MNKRIYMDCNSTMATLPIVQQKIVEMMGVSCNPSSAHQDGQRAKKIIEDARDVIKKSVNADESYELIFTSGGTEANNIIMNNNYTHIISAIEHSSILNSAKNPYLIPVDKDGIIDLEALKASLSLVSGAICYPDQVCGILEIDKIDEKKDCAMLSVVYANNETGVIQDIESIVKIAHKYGAIMHTDAVQAYGKIPIDVKKINVDAITIAVHKIGGGIGVGALIFKKNIKINSLFKGGGQEKGYRSGTENIPAIYGFSTISSQIQHCIESMQQVKLLRDLFEEKIKIAIPEIIICGGDVSRLPNTSSVVTPKISGEVQLMYFDMHGFSLSAGSACSSGKIDTSHVLLAMGLPKHLAKCALRVSLGINNTKDEIILLVNLWETLYNQKV